ncbi:sensor histidine kinase [Candidatus Enterococcus willemsii]|uniref:Sensor histidine kinase NatK-like C-terminal domain-containing protein n=1 Tax=Candidatus Enterococcus willemsii TaxID=1857215 RepID=A0ABQ6YZU0_9ENTE|nr:GHKL domain-containing protein [Enterococcus sp. CU12B]KAF1304139.1 hypothetical protein BAU17_04390 [Enterococcus sp. CU12B]
MFYLSIFSHIIQIFCNFFILDTLPLFKKNNLFLSVIILILTYNLGRNISQVDTIVLLVLLFILSFMNDRTQPIGKLLLTLTLAFLLSMGFDYFATPFTIQVLFSGNNSLMIFWFCFSVACNCLLAFGIQRLFLTKLPENQLAWLGYTVFSLFFVYQLYALNNYIQSNPSDFQFETLLNIFNIFIVLLIFVGILTITLLKRHQRLTLIAQKKEIEYQTMQLYTTELDKQYQEIRKFRHDYINILSSMESYMEAEDMSELKAYYTEHIQPTRAIFSEHFLKLNNLQKIENAAIRSIFMTKLLLAQEKGIPVSLEINEPIQLPATVDPIIFVRILGILLDNAIEELENLQQGTLEVAIFTIAEDCLFVIQNTARADIEPLHQLKTTGFSTKGSHRGLGLSTVDELVQQIPNLLLETSIDKQFTQKLTIFGG